MDFEGPRMKALESIAAKRGISVASVVRKAVDAYLRPRKRERAVSAKVRWLNESWWVVTHHGSRRYKKRFGPTKADKGRAERTAEKVNAAIALGTFSPQTKRDDALPCDAALRSWLERYQPTLKPTYVKLCQGLIENHLIPHFGSRDLRELRESDLLDFIRAKQAEGIGPGTIKNALSALRRVYSLLDREGRVSRNPATRIGEIMRRVERASAVETAEVETWNPGEVQELLGLARETEPRFAPLLHLLFATGMRRGEALGLTWEDVDFETGTIQVRRAITLAGLSTPKSGKSRRVGMPPALGSELLDLLGARRREALAKGWPSTPDWVFASQSGTAPDPANVDRVWRRLRRKAQKQGVRSLKLHAARHTWATRALRAGKSLRWVASQLGHADPALTLRVYAHALPDEESDLSFADFGDPGRPYTAPGSGKTVAGHDSNGEKAVVPRMCLARDR